MAATCAGICGGFAAMAGSTEARLTPVLSSLLREDAGMAEVVVKNFELDRIPQTMPGTRKHAVEKPVPQLRKRGFDALPHLGQQGLFSGASARVRTSIPASSAHSAARSFPRYPRSPRVTPPSTPSNKAS